MKVFSIVGARPQFIKAAVLSRAFKEFEAIDEFIIHSGQHFDDKMSEIFFKEMHIPKPHINLEVSGGSHGEMTGRMLEKFDGLFREEKPDWVVVFGDTNTTLAAALAAKKMGIKLAHVEAGVRNRDEFMPEEINRIIVDRISTLNFCCTEKGVENLRKEGSDNELGFKVFNYGDVMLDAALYYQNIASTKSTIIPNLHLNNKDYILTTIHRASNVDDDQKLEALINGLNLISKDVQVIFPVHPRTRKKIDQLSLNLDFKPIEPVGYFDMIELIKKSSFVITDSGGVVREAYFFNKPSLFLLEKHVWPELEEIKASASLNSTDPNAIYNRFSNTNLLKNSLDNHLFGYGDAGTKIAREIFSYNG